MKLAGGPGAGQVGSAVYVGSASEYLDAVALAVAVWLAACFASSLIDDRRISSEPSGCPVILFELTGPLEVDTMSTLTLKFRLAGGIQV